MARREPIGLSRELFINAEVADDVRRIPGHGRARSRCVDLEDRMKLHETQRGSCAVLALVFLLGALFGALAFYLFDQMGVPL
jgi:hypothetical protein